MNNGIPNNTPEKNIKVSCQFTDRQQPRYARPYRAHGLFGASVGVHSLRSGTVMSAIRPRRNTAHVVKNAAHSKYRCDGENRQ